MSATCGCSSSSSCGCAGVTNRPGRSSLAYRAGTYASFLEAMQDRISGSDLRNAAGELPLLALTTRDPGDAAIALLDAWAVVGDVLTFYQERIANEAFLRTATERSSVLALAGLVGYSAKPGVSASAFLAYTVESGSAATIPAGTQAQSKPVGTALPQAFETSQDLGANGAWNNLAPRLTRPQTVKADSAAIYLAGLSPNLRSNDPLLIGTETPVLKRIATVEAQTAQKRTLVTLQPDPLGVVAKPSDAAASVVVPSAAASSLLQSVSMVHSLGLQPARHPLNSERLLRTPSITFATTSDTAPAMLKSLFPRAGSQMYAALRNAEVAPAAVSQVAAMRVQATPFGSSAPQKPITTREGTVIGTEEWPIGDVTSITITLAMEQGSSRILMTEAKSESTLRTQEGSTVTIAQSSASVTVNVPIGTETATPTKVGTSSVRAASADGSITWTITDPNRTFTLLRKMVDNAEQAEVSVDASTEPITVSQGQSASVGGDGGRRTTVTYGRTLVIRDTTPEPAADLAVLDMDSIYDHVVPGSWVVIERADTGQSLPVQVKSTQRVAVSRYNLSAKVTRLTLEQEWLSKTDVTLSAIRNTTVLAQSDVLPLAEEPIPDDVSGDQVELDDVYEGLTTGRWLVVQGTRTDIAGTSGIAGAELVMLAGVTHSVMSQPNASAPIAPADPSAAGTTGDAPATAAASASGNGADAPALQPVPGDTLHTSVRFSSKLAYTYDRASVSIAGNVVPATHGMTRNESLGSGSTSQTLQTFKLRQSPVTYVSAGTAKGAQSTLSVTVNDIAWTEIDSLSKAQPTDRVYVAQRDDQDQTSIVFGDGVHGMRLPTGTANVAASYRAGLGSGGNLPASQISLLASKPPGVRSVMNPIASSGGSDSESIEEARENTPLTVTALDRLVSVADYADFARSFAGVSKAVSASVSNGREEVVSVTIAGANNGDLNAGSDLIRALATAFAAQGDPYQPVHLDVCESMLLILNAEVRCLPAFQWEVVSDAIRSALLQAFGFTRARIGQSIPSSRITSAIQGVTGVQSVYIATFAPISAAQAGSPAGLAQRFEDISRANSPARSIPVLPPRFDPKISAIAPGQVAFFSADIPDTLILTEVTA